MKGCEIIVDQILQSPQCSMISPGYTHKKDKHGISLRDGKIPRNPDNLIKLEDTISQRMQIHSKNELIETLEKKIPSLYINCLQKWDDDIMFFIFKKYIEQSIAENKHIAIAKAIWDNSVVTPSREARKKYVQEQKPNHEEMIHNYSQFLKEKLQESDDIGYKETILHYESNITFDGIDKLLQEEDQTYLYLYIDNIDVLSVNEQQRINNLLYARWLVGHRRYIRIKINNGKWARKTRQTRSWIRVETPHDFEEKTISEYEL